MSSKYEEECRHHFNEIGLLGDAQVCRLIGYAEDEDDCYHVVMLPSLGEDTPKIVYSSMVGPWVTLKGIYPRYSNLEHQFTKVWNCPPQDSFFCKLRDLDGSDE